MGIEQVQAFAKTKGACQEAREWLKSQTDPRIAWEACDRPDWMIWYAARRGVDRKVLVRIACDCARTSLRFVPDGEKRPRLAIEAAERWIVGEATIDDVRSAAASAAAYAADAADAADAAAYAAYAAAAAYAAYAAYAAAAYAAAADAYAAYAAAAAAYAAYAADAAAAAADDAARHRANVQMCVIVRKYISYKDVAL